MESIKAIDAIKLAKEVSKVPDGTFSIGFFPYNRSKDKAIPKLRVIEGCKVRTQLPREQFSVDGDNYFLFQDADGNPKTCYVHLIRFMGFPNNNYQPRKVKLHGHTE